jgi:hypothetical protein
VGRLDGKVAIVTSAVLLSLVAGGCSSRQEGVLPNHFAAEVDNPWFPLEPGTTYVYRGRKDGKPSREVLEVTNLTKTILGVRATVLHDNLYLAGKLAERTTDWYAQDADGNVWYLGEATAELDRQGHVTSREGSWQAGMDGAEAGIYMPARPKVGESFSQEFYKGHAEDHFKVVSLHAGVRAPYASSKAALQTREWTPLEPGKIDFKYYVRGVGTVKEQAADESELARLVSVR